VNLDHRRLLESPFRLLGPEGPTACKLGGVSLPGFGASNTTSRAMTATRGVQRKAKAKEKKANLKDLLS
jgi:hypothetical protein